VVRGADTLRSLAGIMGANARDHTPGTTTANTNTINHATILAIFFCFFVCLLTTLYFSLEVNFDAIAK